MNEEIITFVRIQRERLAAEQVHQDGYDPNDEAAQGGIAGELIMLQELCWHFGLGVVDEV